MLHQWNLYIWYQKDVSYCDPICHSYNDCCDDDIQKVHYSYMISILFANYTPDYIILSIAYVECVSISIVNDEVLEPDIEQFTVSVSTADASVFIERATADVFIYDTDGCKF